MAKKVRLHAIAAVVLASLSLGPSHASATVTVRVLANGVAVRDAVVTATARQLPPARRDGKVLRAEMEQENKQFDPFVLPVQVGTTVTFTNHDSFRHHVYSVSPAKPFELKLFGSGEVRTVKFEKEGVVVLGCNIHDSMIAYIYVVGTPYFATTNEQGVADVALPPGNYTLAIWHPDQKQAAATRELTVAGEENQTIDMAVALKRERRQQRPPAADEGAY